MPISYAHVSQADGSQSLGTIVTSAPQVMWGTDGVRVFTVEDGWVWTFAAVDHWNAECVGWPVCTVGSRFAALEPIAQGLGRRYGSVEADVARGLALNQVRYWGIHPSFGFLEEPETNGVVERGNRTLKGASDRRPGLSQPRRRARRRRCVRRTLQPVPAPRKAGVSHATRRARAIRATPCRVAQTCVQETGCGTSVAALTQLRHVPSRSESRSSKSPCPVPAASETVGRPSRMLTSFVEEYDGAAHRRSSPRGGDVSIITPG